MAVPLQKTLLIGYGNPDRQDDGVAWHILVAVARKINYPLPPAWEEGFVPSPDQPEIELRFVLQLTPEMSEDLTHFDRVCFIDAHTGRVPEEVHFEQIAPEMQNSPFTHHLTPAMLVYLTQSLYSHRLDAALVSVRGYEFGFSHELSQSTRNLVSLAVEKIITWQNNYPMIGRQAVK